MDKTNIIIAFCILILIVYIIKIVYLDNKDIEINNIDITNNKLPNEFNNFKILHISDLHSKEFGKNNIELIDKINKVSPDIIVVTGDMFSRNSKEFNVFINLVKDLKNKYTIYYTLGNHEQNIEESSRRVEFEVYLKELKKLNVNILRNDKCVISKNNQSINIYGMEIPTKYYTKTTRYESQKLEFKDIFKEINTKEFNILLSHNPAYFEQYAKLNYDLIMSGHIHGGIVKIPVFGGLLSPDLSFFPKYFEKSYKKNNSILSVSRGLGGIRIFNKPNLIVITLKKY